MSYCPSPFRRERHEICHQKAQFWVPAFSLFRCVNKISLCLSFFAVTRVIIIMATSKAEYFILTHFYGWRLIHGRWNLPVSNPFQYFFPSSNHIGINLFKTAVFDTFSKWRFFSYFIDSKESKELWLPTGSRIISTPT